MVIAMSKEVVWSAVKEPLRLMVLAIIPILLAYCGTLPYEWAAVLVVVLKFIDKLLHEIGKAESTKNNESVLVKGITRF
jgi:hypothetical protein